MNQRSSKSFSDVLDRIQKLWIPGVADFYALLDPDPWTMAFEMVDQATVEAGDDAFRRRQALVVFEDTVLELLSIFKRVREIQGGDFMKQRMTMMDCFWTGIAPGQQELSFNAQPKT